MALNGLVGADEDFEGDTTPPSEPPPSELPAPVEDAPAPVDAAPPDEAKADEAANAGKVLNAHKKSLAGRKASIQEEINALVRERGTTQRERDAISAELVDLRRQRDELKAEMATERPRELQGEARRPKQPEGWGQMDSNDPEPQEADHDDFASYVREQSAWAAREAVRVDRYHQRRSREQDDRSRYEIERQQKFSERYTKFAAENATFAEEVNREDLLLSPPMEDVIKDSPVGPAMMLYLARNPDDVDRLARMHPVLTYGEMKKIEARLEAAHSGSAQSVVAVSKAKPPIKPVDGAPAIHETETEIPNDLDMDEHIARGNALDARRRKAGQRVR